MEKLHLNQLPPSNQLPTEPEPAQTQPKQSEQQAPAASINEEVTFVADTSIDDFFKEATAPAKASADTVIDAVTGEQVEPIAQATPQQPEAPAMTDSDATKQATILMDMRENGQALGLAYMADGGIEDWQRYRYSPAEKRLLVEAWAPIVQGMNLRVNKWIHVLYAEGFATTPLIMLAFKARKHRMENEELKQRIQQLEQERNQAQQPTTAAQDMNRVINLTPDNKGWDRMNYDSKTKWQIDEKGFFVNGKDGYIGENERREKPVLQPAVYERLCKWNGKEVVDKIFGL